VTVRDACERHARFSRSWRRSIDDGHVRLAQGFRLVAYSGDSRIYTAALREASIAALASVAVKRVGATSRTTRSTGRCPRRSRQPGESFWVETNDAHRGTITDETVVYASLEDAVARVGGVNPVTGPIAVEGARAGDCLVISIEEIVLRHAATPATRSTPRVHPDLVPETVICPVEGGSAAPTVRGPVCSRCGR
jgi:hypothetical protein